MDKYEFISDLLDRERIHPDQKERILKLTAKEIEMDRRLGIEIEERVRRLEESIQKGVDEKSGPNNELNPDYIDPVLMSRFLNDFNRHDILCTTTHEIDKQTFENIKSWLGTEEYSFKEHMKLVKECYYELLEKYSVLKKSFIDSRIKSYLFSDYNSDKKIGWSEDNIRISWNLQALREWADSNPGVPPNPDPMLANELGSSGFDDFQPIKISRGWIGNMCQLVNHFKNTIRINFSNNLIDIFNTINDRSEWSGKILFESNFDAIPTNFELFTDVDKLKQCYRDVVQMAFDIPLGKGNEKHHIKVGFREEGSECILSIHHLNSVFTKSLEDLLKQLGQKHRNLKKKSNGMCDLYLKAEFSADKYASLNLHDRYKMSSENIEEFKGVEHTLIFKK